MKKIMKISGIVVAVMLAGSIAMADPRGGMGDYRGGYSCYGNRPSYSSYHGRYDRDRHGSYYRSDHGNLAIGLFGLAALTAVACAVSPPERVYVERRVVYSPSPVVYVQQSPQVVYQTVPAQVEYVRQQSSVIVQQSASYEPPQPATMTINVQNSNGSMTPVTLRQVGVQWVGPKGEYYDNLPTIGQLRPIYGF